MAVGAGAGLWPHSLCDPRRATHPFWAASDATCPGPSSRVPPDFGSGWQAFGQSAQPLPRAAPPGLASNAPLEAGIAVEWMGALELQTRPSQARCQPLLERGGCRLPTRGPWPTSFWTRESQPLQTAERWAGPREQLGNLILPFLSFPPELGLLTVPMHWFSVT